jgi:hypothetical protein
MTATAPPQPRGVAAAPAVLPPGASPLFANLYSGTSEPSWLSRTTTPLFIPYHRLLRRLGGKLPRSPWRGRWALDSGGYNHVRAHGGWVLDPEVYVRHVKMFDQEVRNLDWAAPMDWMCEDDALAATGLTVLAHQRRTVANLGELERIWYRDTDDESPFGLALQGDPDAPEGRMIQSYLDCWDMYGAAGTDPAQRPFVMVGSVCRQQATPKIGALVAALHERAGCRDGVEPLVLHLCGAKSQGITRYGYLFHSADSQAWSYAARRENYKWPGCPLPHTDCRNCFYWALAWRYRVLDRSGYFDQWPSARAYEPSWLNRYFVDGQHDAACEGETVTTAWR